MGEVVKKRNLYERSNSQPEMTEENISLQDVTNALIELSQSLSKLELQDNKAEAKRAYNKAKELEKLSIMIRKRMWMLRLELSPKKNK